MNAVERPCVEELHQNFITQSQIWRAPFPDQPIWACPGESCLPFYNSICRSEVYYDQSNSLGPIGIMVCIFVFGGIAALIIPLACINYMNLTTARSISSSRIADLEELWNKQNTGIPFQYNFYDQIFNQNYRSEDRLSGLLNIFSGIAILIGLLGLVGLVSYSTEQLQKSIGIRKVFGASVIGILFLLTQDFIKLLLIAFVVAIPLSNYFIKDWLSGFVFKINIEVWLILVPGLIILLIALFTIWIQSHRAAIANPIEAIRNINLESSSQG